MFNGESLKKEKENDVVKRSSAQTSRVQITPRGGDGRSLVMSNMLTHFV